MLENALGNAPCNRSGCRCGRVPASRAVSGSKAQAQDLLRARRGRDLWRRACAPVAAALLHRGVALQSRR